MKLTLNRQPVATIVLDLHAADLERHAAAELNAYVRKMSGAILPVANERVDGATVLIGAVARRAMGKDAPQGDSFAIRRDATADALLIAGGSARATLWSVYAFLEDTLGIGFFRDGERVPSLPTLEVPPLNIVETPRFSERFEGNGCIYTYSTSAWGWDEWRAEIDWRAKRRVTEIWPLNVGGEIHGEIRDAWGITKPAKTGGDTKKRAAKKSLHERIRDYARSLGMRVPIILNAAFSKEYFKAHPEIRTILLKWSELEPYRIIHPADPQFHQYLVEYIRRYTERYGTDHLYIAEFTSESRVLEGADNIQDVREMFVQAVSAAIREADPEGVWLPSTWSFDITPEDPSRPWEVAWTPEHVYRYLDAITVPFIVHDLWSEGSKKYQRLDWFKGHPWAFSVLHSFGAGGYIHGDVQELIDLSHELLTNPRAKHCVMYGAQSEQIDFNSFYFELTARLSWDPKPVTLDGFIADYCRLRYGANAGPQLHEAYKLLAETAFGPECGTVKLILDPLYWFRPDLEFLPGWPEDNETMQRFRANRPTWLPKLQAAIEIFLRAQELLAENRLARRDLVDVTRQWIAERFNIAIIGARDAFLAGDGATFDEAAAQCRMLLANQTRLAASWPAYRLDEKIERHRPEFGDDAARAIKHRHVWVTTDPTQHSIPLRDYYRQDLDGLIADYYAPRVDSYLNLLRTRLTERNLQVSTEEFDVLYTPIEEAFIASPSRTLPHDDPVDVVRDALRRSKGSSE